MSDAERFAQPEIVIDKLNRFNNARLELGNLAVRGEIELPLCIITPKEGTTLEAKHLRYFSDGEEHSGSEPIVVNSENPFCAQGKVTFSPKGFAHIEFSTPLEQGGFSPSGGEYDQKWVLVLDSESIDLVTIIPSATNN